MTWRRTRQRSQWSDPNSTEKVFRRSSPRRVGRIDTSKRSGRYVAHLHRCHQCGGQQMGRQIRTNAVCQAITKDVEGTEWEKLYFKFVELNKAVNVRHPSENSRTKTFWKVKETEGRRKTTIRPASRRSLTGKRKNNPKPWTLKVALRLSSVLLGYFFRHSRGECRMLDGPTLVLACFACGATSPSSPSPLKTKQNRSDNSSPRECVQASHCMRKSPQKIEDI